MHLVDELTSGGDLKENLKRPFLGFTSTVEGKTEYCYSIEKSMAVRGLLLMAVRSAPSLSNVKSLMSSISS